MYSINGVNNGLIDFKLFKLLSVYIKNHLHLIVIVTSYMNNPSYRLPNMTTKNQPLFHVKQDRKIHLCGGIYLSICLICLQIIKLLQIANRSCGY